MKTIPFTIFSMKRLADYKDELHSCSKCGLCQSVCPIYKITGNDCTVSRGQFIMLQGIIKGELKMSKTINRYLDLCLKCGACTKFCPSGIDVVDIVALAKAEYFKLHKTEKLKTTVIKILLNILHFIHNINIFKPKSKVYDKKVVYFAGCGGVQNSVIKLLNSMNIEVISPNFSCCGFPLFVRGDMRSFKKYMDKFYFILEKYSNYDIVTNCATCEKTLKSYQKYGGKIVNIKNIFQYIRENNLRLELNNLQKVTFHKPCNLDNFEDIKWILENTKNLEYLEMKDFDKCCGLNGITKLSEYKTFSKLFAAKHNNIAESGASIVLTSCLGCEASLKLFSFGKYNVMDIIKFIEKNSNTKN